MGPVREFATFLVGTVTVIHKSPAQFRFFFGIFWVYVGFLRQVGSLVGVGKVLLVYVRGCHRKMLMALQYLNHPFPERES